MLRHADSLSRSAFVSVSRRRVIGVPGFYLRARMCSTSDLIACYGDINHTGPRRALASVPCLPYNNVANTSQKRDKNPRSIYLKKKSFPHQGDGVQ